MRIDEDARPYVDPAHERAWATFPRATCDPRNALYRRAALAVSDPASTKQAAASEEGNAPATPPGAVLKEEGAVLKEEGAVPPMPPGAFVKEEGVVPPMPPDAVAKREHAVVVKEEERSDGRAKRRRSK